MGLGETLRNSIIEGRMSNAHQTATQFVAENVLAPQFGMKPLDVIIFQKYFAAYCLLKDPRTSKRFRPGDGSIDDSASRQLMESADKMTATWDHLVGIVKDHPKVMEAANNLGRDVTDLRTTASLLSSAYFRESDPQKRSEAVSETMDTLFQERLHLGIVSRATRSGEGFWWTDAVTPEEVPGFTFWFASARDNPQVPRGVYVFTNVVSYFEHEEAAKQQMGVCVSREIGSMIGYEPPFNLNLLGETPQGDTVLQIRRFQPTLTPSSNSQP